MVRKSDKIKALGTRHCFNNIADSKVQQMSLKDLSEVMELDKDAGTVTVGAGIRYGQLSPYLHDQGYARLCMA